MDTSLILPGERHSSPRRIYKFPGMLRYVQVSYWSHWYDSIHVFCLQFLNGNKVQVGEVQYLTWLAIQSTLHAQEEWSFADITMIKLYSELDVGLLHLSSQVLTVSLLLDDLLICNIKSICSVVAMIPCILTLLNGVKAWFFCMMEKPGVDISDLRVHQQTKGLVSRYSSHHRHSSSSRFSSSLLSSSSSQHRAYSNHSSHYYTFWYTFGTLLGTLWPLLLYYYYTFITLLLRFLVHFWYIFGTHFDTLLLHFLLCESMSSVCSKYIKKCNKKYTNKKCRKSVGKGNSEKCI